MNILFLAYNINIHSRTGDAIHVRELALNMAALGNKVSLVVGFNPSSQNIGDFTNNTNLDITYIKEPRIKFPKSRDLSIISKCLGFAKKSPFDIVYERNFSCRIGVILSKILRIPLIVEINGIIDEEAEMQGRHISLIRGIIGKRLGQLFFMYSNKIVAVSPGIKEGLINKYHITENKIEVVPNGADIDLFKPMNQEDVKNELGLSLKFKYICFVGNLAPWQGVDNLINIAPAVIQKIPGLKFLIVGDGIMKNTWEEMVRRKGLSEYFIFTGYVPYATVPKYINASDICAAIFASKRKCSPIKVFEYLACAKPVILNDIGKDIEMFANLKSTLIVSFDDPNKFANDLNQILSNQKLMIQMGDNGRNFICESYTWKNTAQRVVEICKNEINCNH